MAGARPARSHPAQQNLTLGMFLKLLMDSCSSKKKNPPYNEKTLFPFFPQGHMYALYQWNLFQMFIWLTI